MCPPASQIHDLRSLHDGGGGGRRRNKASGSKAGGGGGGAAAAGGCDEDWGAYGRARRDEKLERWIRGGDVGDDRPEDNQ